MKVTQIWQKFENWLFNYPQKQEINIHSSLTSPSFLIIWRLIALLILSFRYVLSILQFYQSAFDIVEYLTQLGYALTWIYFATVIQDYILNRKKPKISKSLKNWINLIFQIAICIELVVTILFWMILYDYKTKFEVISFLKQVGVHGFPFVCLVFDLIFNIYQFPRRHLIIVVTVGISYLALNIIYSLIVKPIYAPLDWVTLMSYVYIVGSLGLVIIFHILIGKFWQKYRRPQLKLLETASQTILDVDIQ